MQYIDETNASAYSTFTQDADLTPDQLIMFQDVSATEMADMLRLQTLQAKTYLTDLENIEMTGLLVSLREFMPTSEDWNKLCAGLYSLQVFMRDGIVMFIQEKQDEFTAMLEDYTFIGVYNNIYPYKKGNMVSLNGYGFSCRQDCQGVSPDTNGNITDYWVCYTIKGDKGDPSLNISYRGEYDENTTYNLSNGDAVTVDGTLYYAKADGVIGLYPPYYLDNWTSLTNDAIYISTVLPTIGNRRKDTLYFLQTDVNNLEIGILQDYLGNTIQPKTDASNVVYNGDTVENALNSLNNDNIAYVVATNSGNNYSVTIPNLTTLTDGLQIRIKFNVASTGSITVNVNGLGVKNVVDYFGNQVTNVRQNLIANLCYESVSGNFILQGKGGGGNATPNQLIKNAIATTDTGVIVGTLDLSNLITSNIKKNITINGITGSPNVVDTSDATVVASKMLNGESGYVKGNKITGNILSKTAQSFKPSTVNQTISSGYYLSGTQTILGYPDLVSANIVKDKIIGDTVGTATISQVAYGLAYTSIGANNTTHSVTVNVGFQPSLVIIYDSYNNTEYTNTTVNNLYCPILNINIKTSIYLETLTITTTGFTGSDTWNRTGGDVIHYACFK